MISDDARDIVGSKMILNLNEPSKSKTLLGLMKYIGFGGNACWEIDLGFCGLTKCTNSLTQDLILRKTERLPKIPKRYIDFYQKWF
jgi:hypothetical protein